ncbi:MAG: M23 family metallopeptidase [Oscillospiraceae bacterium]|nr:M23 family metallopeptidase [Oscillospiraceae bacterium]
MNRFFPNYEDYKITSRFGMRTLNGVTKMHKGIDLVAKRADGGSAVDYITAHTGGTVVGVGFDASAGNYIKLQTAPGVVMVYYHMKAPSKLQKGMAVATGQVIGTMGATGKVTGAHLHFGIQVNGEWVDPEPYLDRDYLAQSLQVALPVLRRGDKGETVRAMQALLALRGCACGVCGTDGSFGPDTQGALTAFSGEKCCEKAVWEKLLGVGA